jgi:hypothetical protein
MTSPKTSDMTVVLDPLPATLDRLASLAISVLSEHVSNPNGCPVCGSPSPCDLAVLADHNLAVL